MAVDGSIVIDTSIDQTGADRDLKELKGKLEKAGEGIKKVGSTLTKFVTVPLAGAALASAKFAMDQEQSFAKVSTLLDESETDFKVYKQAIRDASSEMGVSFDEYAESVYGSISAGVDAGNAIDFVAQAAKLAKGGFTDTATAVDVMTTAINAYGLEQSDATRIADMLINTQNLGKTTVDELAGSMGAVIPVANANAVSLEQLSTGYAILTKNGVATSEAGTQLKAMFGELGKSGSITDKVLREKLGKSFKELSEEGMSTSDILNVLAEDAEANGLSMGDMFGSMEAGNAAMTLIKDGGDDYNKTLESMQTVSGETEEAFNKMENTAKAKLGKAFNDLRNNLAALGDLFLPTITRIIEKIAELISWFSDISPASQKLLIAFGVILALLGPFLVFVGIVVSLAGSIAGMMATAALAGTTLGAVLAGLAAPVAIAIGIFVALIAIGVLVYKNWDTIKEYTIRAWNAIIDFLQPAIDLIVSTITERMQLLSDWWGELQDNLKAAFENIWGAIVTSAQTLTKAFMAVFEWMLPWLTLLFTTTWDFILGIIDGAINVVMGLIGAFAALFTGNWSMLWKNIITVLEGVWGIILNVFALAWNAIGIAIVAAGAAIIKLVTMFMQDMWAKIVAEWEIIKAFFSEAWETVKQVFSDAVESIKQYFANLGADIMAVLQPYIDFWVELFTSAWESIKGVFTSAIESIVQYFTDLGTSVMEVIQPHIDLWAGLFTLAWETIKATFQAALDWIKSTIAAVLGSEVVQELMLTVNYWKEKIVAGWEAIKLAFTVAFIAIKTLVTNWLTEQTAKITEGFEFVRSAIALAWERIVVVVGGFLIMIRDLIVNWILEQVTKITEGFEFIKSAISTAWENIKLVVGGFLLMIKELVTNWINEKLAIITAVLELIKGVFSRIWTGIKDAVSGFLGGMKSDTDAKMNESKSALSGILDAIKGVFTNAWNNIKEIVTAAINLVKAVITTVFNAIKTFFSVIWEVIKGIFVAAMRLLRGDTEGAFNRIKETITNVMDTVKNFFKSSWNSIKETLSAVLSVMGRNVSRGFDAVKDFVKSGIEGALKIVTDIGSKFKTAGGKIISMLAEGITGGVKSVTDAIGGVVARARDFLPFSPAKTGPLEDIDKLNFHGPMVDSIKKGSRYVQSAMGEMLKMPEINHSLAVNGSYNAPSQAERLNPTINVPKQDIVIKSSEVILEGKVVGEVIWEEVGNQSRRHNGARAQFREGGLSS